MVRLFNIGEPDPIKPESDTIIIPGMSLYDRSNAPTSLSDQFEELLREAPLRSPLPAGYILDATYKIENVLGQGGFGITYRAFDQSFDVAVAIKEFFPSQLAVRTPEGQVVAHGEAQELFQWGRTQFIKEARTLIKFRHPNLVGVYSLFEANGTFYMTLEMIDGPSLKDWTMTLGAPPDQKTLDSFVTPILDAVASLHSLGFLHRDIKPGNIMLRQSKLDPVLVDFGSSGNPIKESEDQIKILTPGYAPVEQYAVGSTRQGPWTDIYSLGATFYEIVAGKPPIQSIERMMEDHLENLATLVPSGRYRPEFLKAIHWALAVKAEDRPQSIEEWRPALLEGVTKRPKGTKIFISYRRSDARHIAGRMFDRLAQEFGDDEIFFDVDSIPMGVDFRGHIAVSLKDSAVVLAIVGPAWVNKQWGAKRSFFSLGRPPEDFVETEIALAIESGVPIIPVLVDNVAMPPAVALPSALKSFVYLNGSPVRAGRDFKSDMDRVVAAIREQRGEPAPAAPESKT